MNTRGRLFLIVAATIPSIASAQIIDIDFAGNAGSGLLPGNEIGANTPIAPGAPSSTAIGGETGAGLIYNTTTNELDFDFEFSGLSGGLFDAASGIHFHTASPGTDPFNETGGITFNLNSGTDPNVLLTTPLIAIGATSGNVAGTATLSDAQEADLLAGNLYLNIHSGTFNGGELRANLVPEPATASLLLVAGVAALRRRCR